MAKQPDRIYPRWQVMLLAAWPWLIAALFVGTSAVLLVVSDRFDRRLEAIEDVVAFEMPPSYTPPDLADHRATGVDPATLTAGATVYVPVYSHIYVAGGHPFLLETTLSIRNIDPDAPLYVSSVVYYDSDGQPVQTYVDELIRLRPLETIDFTVEQEHTAGGSGANFLVSWAGVTGVEPPLIESVMAGYAGQHSLSFARQGTVLGGAGR